jgi:YHS domain-containing protein
MSRNATTQRHALSIAFLSLALSASTALAQTDAMRMKDGSKHDNMATPAMIQNVDASGVAMKGFDAVAYFTAAKPTKGSADFEATFHGATFRFASAQNRDLFMKTPEKYAPQYGGYCAMGVAYNGKFDIDPDAWKIADGKLYLNKDMKTQQMWFKDIPGNIVKADKIWPVLGAAK